MTRIWDEGSHSPALGVFVEGCDERNEGLQCSKETTMVDTEILLCRLAFLKMASIDSGVELRMEGKKKIQERKIEVFEVAGYLY